MLHSSPKRTNDDNAGPSNPENGTQVWRTYFGQRQQAPEQLTIKY